jgi:mono/diheme cytochrome c family protein
MSPAMGSTKRAPRPRRTLRVLPAILALPALLLLAVLAAWSCGRQPASHRVARAAPAARAAGTAAPAAAPAAPAPGGGTAEGPTLAYEARMGREIYGHYCQTCHGDIGAGDGFNAFNLDPRPGDLSAAAFQKSKTDADLADAIRRGGAGVGLSALMPPYGHTLSDRQIAALVAFLRTLRKPA